MVVNYVCSNCLKEFNLKGNYTQHLNRKKPCLAVIPKIQVIKEENPLQCCECFKHFSTKTNRVRHEKNGRCAFKECYQTIENKVIKIIQEQNILQEQNKKIDDNTENQVIKVLNQQNKKMDDKFTNFMENQLKHNINFPINNQLINLIVDKTNTIGERKSIINSKEVNHEIPIHELTELIEKMQKELDLKDQKIKLLEDAYIKKQHRKDYPEKNVIYMLTTEDHKNKRIYIIGKARDLKNRLSGYNKTTEHEVVYYKECKSEDDMNIIEVMVLNKLKEYKEKANRDRFVLPIENDIIFFTNIIDLCVNFYT